MKLFVWWFASVAAAQTLTGPASVNVGDPVFLRLANGVVPVRGASVRVSSPARELGTVAATALNFRESAGGAVRGVLYRGDRVLIRGQTGDGWCEVIAGHGGSGYVGCDYLDREPFGQPVGITDVDGRVVALGLSVVPGVVSLEAGGASFNIEVRAPAEDTSTLVAPGITLRTRRWVREGDGPFAMQILEADPAEPNVLVLPVRAHDRAVAREKTSAMAQRYGAVAAVNGGPFMGGGVSLSDYVLGGQSVAVSPIARPALRRCMDGRLTIEANCAVSDVVGGGPRLVADGRVAIGPDGFGNERVRMARTAFAITAGGTYLFVTVDGRPGLRLDEFAAELVAVGAVRAVNLDGGASTTMVVADTVRNSPVDGAEREVSDAVLVFSVHDLASLRQVMDRVALDPGQVATEAIEPIYQRYDNAVTAFAAEELDRVRMEVEALRGEVVKRSGGELTVAAARVLGEAATAYLRLLPGIQQALKQRRAYR